MERTAMRPQQAIDAAGGETVMDPVAVDARIVFERLGLLPKIGTQHSERRTPRGHAMSGQRQRQWASQALSIDCRPMEQGDVRDRGRYTGTGLTASDGSSLADLDRQA